MLHSDNFIAPPHSIIKLEDYKPDDTSSVSSKSASKKMREEHTKRLKDLQALLYAHNRYALLLIFQGIDASGKDSTIKHVMSGVNPQGCQVHSFKEPSEQELEHDFLWRTYKVLPEKGRIGIFNRSYYEEVIVTQVHPHYISRQRIPGIKTKADITTEFWENRYRSINDMERHLSTNGTLIMKFYLNLSAGEQKQRFLKRIHRPDKHWKFTMSDMEERAHWERYTKAFEKTINHTSTSYAPWHIIPADHKWYMRTVVGQLIVEKLESLDLHFPRVSSKQEEEIETAQKMLTNED